MIDRPARDKTVAAIEAYMNDEITAFAFDEAIFNVSDETDDESVRTLVMALWFFYDDLKDHKIVAGEEQWDILHRIILFLRSDTEIASRSDSGKEVKRIRRWSITQLAALGMMVLLAVIVWNFGESWELLIVWVAGGVLTWKIDRRIRKPLRDPLPEPDANTADTWPFDSPEEFRHAEQSVPDFHKRPFPPELAKRRIRNALLEMNIPFPRELLVLLKFIGWTIVLPLVLLGQIFPMWECRRTMVLNNNSRERSEAQ